ncbi:DNA polymerase III subunit chi [Colwellia sp. 1_MG-2023]|uniref:DNA polymerase III subunit chi n=1 Tax=Colwellia sp. 1_MG-2023 TaxID=3062649 RepID=UPI0026E1B013|nr:DNA polymerase III subunit chi [Colwellia sp. 1_MG-2023]MDO6447132.1 DNA polymerase III subunit chi [Colwellia sp. 1_MG-2023]
MMNTQVMFYLLEHDENAAQANNNPDKHYLSLLHSCFQAAHFYRQNQRVFIYCQDQAQAHQVDELLWSFEPDSFVPHNLVNEGQKNGAAVEISWQVPTNRRPVLINLTSTVPNFAHQFSQIVDFVPSDEHLKQNARERFKAYRQLGFQVGNQPASSSQATS